MLPPFDISGGLPLATARGVSVAGLLSTFGALLARVAFMPPAPAMPRLARAWRRLVWLSLLVAALGSAAWCWQVAGTLADEPGFAATATTVPVLLAHTLFGHVLLLRLALLAAVAASFARAPAWLAAALAGLAVLTQAAHGHAFSMQPGLSPLLLSDALHLLAAGAWLGGLLPLLVIVRAGPSDLAARACRDFSWLGGTCVLLLAGTALFQGWTLIGSLPALVGTAYGLIASLKLLLFLALLALAASNRFRHTPALSDRASDTATRRMVQSIAAETAIGLLVVLAAGVLTSLPPSMHTPTIWPFAERPSLVTVREDPDFRREVIAAALALGAAVALLVVAALIRRRARWLAVAAAGVIAWFAVPHLDLLFVAAYPTSYQHSPTGFAADGIVHGAALYPGHCAACHGVGGRGDGPAAKGLPVPPADLTAAHLWMHSDGELIWWLSHGIDAPEGGLAMPGFAGVLPRQDLWDLIDYIRARNAGLTRARTGAWSPPVRAPGLQAACADGRTVTLDSLRGGIVRLILGAPVAADAAAHGLGITTIVASADPAPHPAPAFCVARDESVARAYAIVAGLAPGEVAGAQFLIDADGWLRAEQRPEAASGWNDPQALARQVADIRAHPISGTGGDDQPMHMPM